MPKPDPFAEDEDNPALTEEQLAALKPASATFTPEQLASLAAQRGPGRPPKLDRRVEITLRVAPDVLEFYKAKGRGWQTRMHAALQRAMKGRRY